MSESLTTELIPIQGSLASVAFRRSARARKISLRIDATKGGIIITLPMRASRRAGLALLEANEHWAATHLANLPEAIHFRAGASVPIDDMPHIITPIAKGRGGAWIENGHIMVTGEPEFLTRRVSDCLKRLARQRFTLMALEKAKPATLKPKIIRVKDTYARWGSCAPDGSLAFCWRLICAPIFVQDYVVGHEVAHLKHMDHGPQFWAMTDSLTPHRDAASAWLATHGQALLRIG